MTQTKSNFTKQQWNQLNDLKLDRNIIIKETDKGGTVVIMDAKHYANIIQNMLQDMMHTMKKPNNTNFIK